MADLFSHFAFLLPQKTRNSLNARLRKAAADPFEVLHRINWSAPWLERKF